jgi:hypothetical protein
MATLNDLFGGGGNFGPKVANPKNVGEFVKGTIVKIDRKGIVQEWDAINKKPGLQKFWVDGKPKGVPADEAERAGLNPVHQLELHVEVTGTNIEGVEGVARIVIGSKDERERFKEAVEAAGGSIDVGDTIGKKLIKREGNLKFHEIKVIKA